MKFWNKYGETLLGLLLLIIIALLLGTMTAVRALETKTQQELQYIKGRLDERERSQ
jgi:uncharacterized membrane protein